MHYSEQIKTVFEKEIEALKATQNSIDSSIDNIIDAIIECKGKVVISGIGKSGQIGAKIASTFSSMGTPSIFLHPTDALHGDLGILDERDIVALLSNSGETAEVISLLPHIKNKGIKTIGFTGNNQSTLFKECDLAFCFPEFQEACRFGVAPTSSTTALLTLGDALAVVISEQKNFQKDDLASVHPGGILGGSV